MQVERLEKVLLSNQVCFVEAAEEIDRDNVHGSPAELGALYAAVRTWTIVEAGDRKPQTTARRLEIAEISQKRAKIWRQVTKKSETLCNVNQNVTPHLSPKKKT